MGIDPDGDAFSTIRLRDGRSLAFLEVGNPNGPAVIHCHGSGSSRLEVLFMAHVAEELRIRLIGIDRPGIGRSHPHQYRNILDWTNDVAEFVGQLGLEEFAVSGMSNGGAYAMACACRFPERLKACGLISSITPAEIVRIAGRRWLRMIWWIGQHYPAVFRSYLRLMVPDTKPTVAEAGQQVRRWARWMSESDQRALQDARLRTYLASAMAEHRRQGSIGGRYEAEVGMKPWGFALQDVQCRSFLWYAGEDRLVTVSQARALAAALPNCTATFFPYEGHLSIMANHAHDILARLI